MVVSTILACFSNNMPIPAYFGVKFCIKHLLNIYKVIQLFTLLSDLRTLILSIILEGERSFNPPSTPSRLNFTLLRPPPLPHHPRSRPLASNFACRFGRQPLPSIEGCGLDFHHHCSLTNEDAVPHHRHSPSTCMRPSPP